LRTGTIVVVERHLLHEDGAFAPAAYARLGFLSPPGPDGVSRLSIALDLEVASATLNGRSWPSSIQLSLGGLY
jgi:hypothetical protein